MSIETAEEPLSAPRPWYDPLVLLAGLAALILAAGLGFWFGARTGSAPTEASPEVGFARDMAIHHAQAVDMATILRDATDDPDMRQIALDIMLTQQAQIGQMQGWLNAWNLPLPRVEPAMAWMGMPTTGPMPGMAAPAELNRLRTLKGLDADGLFLTLMIPHHRGGVAMAQALLNRSQRPEVRALAEAIVNAQESEIELMQSLLQRKGFPLVPDDTGMDHENMTP
jgi:uncharacterized protein (DUF305 family)